MSDALRIGLRFLGLAIGVAIGWQAGSLLALLGDDDGSGDRLLALALSVGTIGYILGPRVSRAVFRNLQQVVKEASVTDLVAIAVGLAFGGLVSALVAVPLAQLPSPYGSILPLVGAVVMIALAIAVALLRKRDLIVPLVRGRLAPKPAGGPDQAPATASIAHAGTGAARANGRPAPGDEPGTLLDTSVIIDGRLPDLIRTGFLEGRFVVPRFVLDELQFIADSDEPMRRARGRRGLDTLNRLRQESPERFGELEVVEADFGGRDLRQVDAKLVRLAKERGYRILTNDYNLNRVAQIQGVRVLNLHELSGALRPPVLPGEELSLKLIQEGREAGQGVGFLEDGTMVVVDGGKPWVGRETDVTVTRLLQTGAGRLVFAVPKHAGSSA